jgi:hypothetical protein
VAKERALTEQQQILTERVRLRREARETKAAPDRKEHTKNASREVRSLGGGGMEEEGSTRAKMQRRECRCGGPIDGISRQETKGTFRTFLSVSVFL